MLEKIAFLFMTSLTEKNRLVRGMGRSLTALLVVFGFFSGTLLQGAERSFSLKDAAGKGVFNIGPSKGSVSPVNTEPGRSGVLQLVFDAPSGSHVGVWTKGYPSELGDKTAKAVRISVKSASDQLAREASVAVEIKGEREVQKISVALQSGWVTMDVPIEWDRVGPLKEVVFVVSPIGGDRKGTLLFDLEFLKTGAVVSKKLGGLTIAQAGSKGIFNIKGSEGKVTPLLDSSLKREVFKFEYKAPPGSFVGIWTKGYPSTLNAENFNGVKVSVKGSSAQQAKEVQVVLEIKGSRDVQKIPLHVDSRWKAVPHLIDWKLIGDLREVVFVLAPIGPERKGTFWVDLTFVKFPKVAPVVEGTFTLSDARGRGAFNTGPATLSVGSAFDDSLGKEVVTLAASFPPKVIVGLWTKDYPPTLLPSSVNGVTASLFVPASSVGELTAALELKGSNKEFQTIPIPIKAGWNTVRHEVNWVLIGQLKEAVFVLKPAVKSKPVLTTVSFDLEFSKGDFPKTVAAVPSPPAEGTPGEGEDAPLLSHYGIGQAGAIGVFNIKDSEGLIDRSVDPDLKKEVLRFTYRCAPGAVVGIWSKDYPAGLSKKSVNGVRVSANLTNPAIVSEIELKLELKGEKIQTIPLVLQPGVHVIEEAIDWALIGNLKEAVFVLTPLSGGERTGTVSLDLEFFKGELPVKETGPSGAQKTLWILLLALGVSFFFKRVGKWAKKVWGQEKELEDLLGEEERQETTFSRMRFHFLTGLALVLTAATSLAIYALGTVPVSALSSGIWIGAAGVLIAELYKFTRTKTHLTSGEIFQNFFVTGFLWATASTQVLWQAPTAWTHVLMKSHITAGLVCAIYHVANGVRLSSSGKHLRPISAAMIVGSPFLFGWLLMLETVPLLQSIGAFFMVGAGSGWPALQEFLGRFVLLFVFNQLVAHAIGYATKGIGLKTKKAHAWIALVTLCVVLAPSIADWGASFSVATLPDYLRIPIALLTAMLSQGGLWMEAYLITGMILDGMLGYAPNGDAVARHGRTGFKKGMAYSGLFMGFLYGIKGLVLWDSARLFFLSSPIIGGMLFGALIFPLIKTIIESFDGSMPFLVRARYGYRQWTLYLRGIVVGGVFAYGLTSGMMYMETEDRLFFGLMAGLMCSSGVSLLRDLLNGLRNKGRIQTLRVYIVDSLVGVFIGSLVAFYLDAVQVTAIIEKFGAYTSVGLEKTNFTVYSLVSKWGRIDLGGYTGGVKLLFDEALAGLITWSIAAPLFAINRVFMTAYFQRDKAPIKYFFSKAGASELVVNLIHVMRWGLWMSPIINTGIHMMAKATWYNQDGAIRTLYAIFKNLTLSPGDFQAWSLGVFVSLLAVDLVRVLIWIDHMGLRVATLVNLSFIGMDKLDEKIARYIGPSAAQRYLPESVKRFTTWGPLLIPFYIPRGADWDFAWTKSQELQKAGASAIGFSGKLLEMPWDRILLWGGSGVLLVALVSAALKGFSQRNAKRRPAKHELANREYKVVVQSDGAAHSEILAKGYDLTRRSYDILDPAGRALFVVDTSPSTGAAVKNWPVLGNFPTDRIKASQVEQGTDSIWVVNTENGLRTTLEIKLPDVNSAAERWTVQVENMSETVRNVKVVPYLEWVMDNPQSDRGHTQYGRLFPEMEYLQAENTLLAYQKKTKSMGFLASDIPTEGFHSSRMDFIGRARSLWAPRLLETLAFLDPKDTSAYPTFDPIGSLLLGVRVEPKSSRTVNFLVGYAKDRDGALGLVKKHLNPRGASASPGAKAVVKKTGPLVGHGEILPGTPLPYSSYTEDGNTLVVHTPFTPRPYDHALSNDVGHYVMVTNRGLHMTANGNSQQNPITTDWADTVTRELPGEAIYLYDTDSKEWYSPTHHPLNDLSAKHECRFGVDGTATFQMNRGDLSTELVVFVPPSEPTGVYLLTVKNNSAKPRRLRLAPYFQITLASQGEPRRPALQIHKDSELNAVFFENPGNAFRAGPAFVAMSLPWDQVETKRGRFMGKGRGVARPFMVEKGEPDQTPHWDDRPIAGFLGTLEIPPQGERTVVVLLGQTDSKKKAGTIIRKYKTVEAARIGLEETRRWWLGLMSTTQVKTNQPEFDRFQNWLKYQGLAERIWARRGFYQTSGAYGFRDQLQDSVNLIWVDPALARKQILLHASQQFLEGDVVHWFHTLHDGRSAFSNRSHASDNLLWLAWGAGEYVRMTGDESLLDERTTYLKGENPFLPLPKNKHGWGTIYLRSVVEDSVYRHCMKSIDLVLEKRMGAHGLPLIGTGDWNDGLDEIGSEGRGESVWLGFFLHYILKNMVDPIEKIDGRDRKEYYLRRLNELEAALERTWRDDRYLRAIHDDGTEIGLKDSGVWEIDALTAAWAVYAGINPERNRIVFQTALKVLERDNVILLGWPALREGTKPYLGRSSHYPEGVRENGMYCHGVQWLVRAARLLVERAELDQDVARAKEYREAAYRLWMKISPLSHLSPTEIELYGGQPNKQSADMLTTYDQGRMIWHGYTGAAGWMLRQAMEGVVGAQLVNNAMVLPADMKLPRGPLVVESLKRDVSGSPLQKPK